MSCSPSVSFIEIPEFLLPRIKCLRHESDGKCHEREISSTARTDNTHTQKKQQKFYCNFERFFVF